jgi:lipoprotein
MKILVLFVLGMLLSFVSCKNFPIGHGPRPVDTDSLDSTGVVDSIDSVASADSMAKMAEK